MKTVSSQPSKMETWDFPDGPVAKRLCSQCRGPEDQSLGREVDPHMI